MHISIKKASIKNSLFLAYEYVQSVNNTKNIIKTSSDAPIHDDLRNAFSTLVPHFALICEEIDEKTAKKAIQNPEEVLEEQNPLLKYKVTGFSIGGSGDAQGVTISGNKKLANGSVVNFNTPFLKFDDYNEYEFMEELQEAIDTLKSEVYEYLEGKQAPSKQLEIFGNNDNEESSI